MITFLNSKTSLVTALVNVIMTDCVRKSICDSPLTITSNWFYTLKINISKLPPLAL